MPQKVALLRGFDSYRSIRDLDLSVAAPYMQVQTMFDPFFPEGELCHYWTSINLDRVDDEIIDAVVTIAEDRPDPGILI